MNESTVLAFTLVAVAIAFAVALRWLARPKERHRVGYANDGGDAVNYHHGGHGGGHHGASCDSSSGADCGGSDGGGGH